MNGQAIWGGLIVIVSVGMIVWTVWNQCVPARWPMPRMYRSEHPVYYWLSLGGYVVAIALGAALALI